MTWPRYEHTQRGWPMRIAFIAVAIGLLVLSASPPFAPLSVSRGVLLAGGAFGIALGWLWSSLTVRVDASALSFRYGLGWPRKTIPLAEIVTVETTRTTFWEGWGVHRTRRGWLYNVGGYDAVLLKRRDGSALLVGSDEAPRLKAAIERARTQH